MLPRDREEEGKVSVLTPSRGPWRPAGRLCTWDCTSPACQRRWKSETDHRPSPKKGCIGFPLLRWQIHKLHSLKPLLFTLSWSWRAGVLKSRCQPNCVAPRGLSRDSLSLPSLASRGYLCFLAPGPLLLSPKTSLPPLFPSAHLLLTPPTPSYKDSGD